MQGQSWEECGRHCNGHHYTNGCHWNLHVVTWHQWCALGLHRSGGTLKRTLVWVEETTGTFLESEHRRHLHIHSEQVSANKLHLIHQQKTGSIAQYMGYVKRIQSTGLDTRGTDTTILPILLADSMLVGPTWERARLLVDSGSEHPHLISQSLVDRMGLHGIKRRSHSGQL